MTSTGERDGFGLPLSAGPAAAEAYRRGVLALLTADVGAAEALDQAIALEPDFALAHIARARLLWLRAEVAAARAACAQATRLADRLGSREQRHVQALAHSIEGRPVQALAASREHLALFPRDAMVLAPCTNVFGLFGFSGRPGWERELADFLDQLASHWPDDGWFLSLQAFAAGEIGDHARARALAERSLALAPRNAHGAHGLAHVLYETGDPATAVAFLGDWLPTYPREGQFRVHLHWHQALSLLAIGESRQAWQVYRCAVSPPDREGPQLNILTDAAAFLWRAELAGQAVPRQHWQSVADFAATWFAQPGLAFADLHVAMALAAVGDLRAVDRLADRLASLAAAGRLPAGAVVPAACRAFGAWRRQAWDEVVEHLAPVASEVQRLGGSRAQRDLPAAVLLHACRMAGHPDPANLRPAASELLRPRPGGPHGATDGH